MDLQRSESQYVYYPNENYSREWVTVVKGTKEMLEEGGFRSCKRSECHCGLFGCGVCLRLLRTY